MQRRAKSPIRLLFPAMSTKSKARNVKRPTSNARREVKKTLAAKPAKVYDPGTGDADAKPIPFNAEPGHRDLGLIPRRRTGIRMEPATPAAKGAFSAPESVTKAAARRQLKKLERKAALVA